MIMKLLWNAQQRFVQNLADLRLLLEVFRADSDAGLHQIMVLQVH